VLTEAEPLMRRALAISERSLGADHPNFAIRLANLALLFQATNRLTEAEPLMRRALGILFRFSAENGREHPHLQAGVANYARLLDQTGLTEQQVASRLDELALNRQNF